LDSDLVQRYPLLRVSLSIISVQVIELEVFWPDDGTEPVGERSKA
jgi:hypothetical protein